MACPRGVPLFAFVMAKRIDKNSSHVPNQTVLFDGHHEC
jgi:hypothetical protein